MACGPNLAPGRCDVPPSNGAPMIIMSVPAQDAGSARSARSTPRNVASGPYIPPSLLIVLTLLLGWAAPRYEIVPVVNSLEGGSSGKEQPGDADGRAGPAAG